MNRQLLAVAALGALLLGSAKAQEPMKIAVIGLVHAHAWGHLPKMVAGKPATLVGVAETVPELVAEAKKIGVADNLIYADYNKMLETLANRRQAAGPGRPAPRSEEEPQP